MNDTKLVFFQRTFPSANMVLIKDRKPVLIDTGYGSDAQETEQLIRDEGVSPSQLHLIVNTHYHSDHAGGNFHFQENYGTRIAAHKWEAALVNSRDPEACTSEWLDQPVDPYQVNVELTDQDEISTGNRVLKVLHTPGHTLGLISLYEPEEKVLICGDFFHSNDLGWFNIFRGGVASIQRAMESLERVAQLPIKIGYSGHGPAIEDPQRAIDMARNRYEKWLKEPEKIAWHGLKRVFAYALMIRDGLPREEVNDYLLSCGWFQDFARYSFQLEPEEFIQPLLDEMLRSRAAHWQDDKLMATTPYTSPPKNWTTKQTMPKDWPPINTA